LSLKATLVVIAAAFYMGYFKRLRDNFGIIWKCNFIFAFQLFLPKTDRNQAYAFIGKHGLTPYSGRYAA
jgi:hypothetical protein